jgi:hypothetical protein
MGYVKEANTTPILRGTSLSFSLMEVEHFIRYAPRAVGLIEIEHLIRYAPRAVGLMVFE